MSSLTVTSKSNIKATITVPGDKSISHRSLIFGALAEGESRVSNLLLGEDVLSTMTILQKMGVKMSHTAETIKPGDILTIQGKGIHSLKATSDILDCGNSGTTMRLMLGLLSAQDFSSTLTGDASLNKRPMERVFEPLRKMGASFEVKEVDGKRLITVHGKKNLSGGSFTLPVASAQVKSAIVLAALGSGCAVDVTEPSLSRDHTERMLLGMGAPLSIKNTTVSLPATSGLKLKPLGNFSVANDFSSAAFFIAAGLIVPGAHVTLKQVNLNPTRAALLDVFKKMDGKIEIQNEQDVSGEKVGDIIARYSSLKGTSVSGQIIPWLIDEIPILSIVASKAQGETTIADAKELRVKESDRIKVMCGHLAVLGVNVGEKPDGMVIQGPSPFKGGSFKSHGDHRVAMSFAIAGLCSDAPVIIDDTDCIKTSFPSFFKLFEKL
ncbi:3-phosphoshikimate 1-carboxyvinyltransferase [bacterium]|nr:3-phosphoshikimate 1-carboxyvinyltransferase [bacterium]